MAAFGSTTALSGGTLTLTRTAGQQWFYIANCDIQPLTLVYQNATGGTLGQEILNPAISTGQEGGRVDSISYPILLDAVNVVLTSSIATAQIASGASTRQPTNIAFVQPSSQRGN